MSMSHRVNAIRVQTKRELRSTLYGTGLYIVLFLIFLGTSYLFLRSSLFNVTDAGIMALRNPITQPLFFAIGLAAAYLGLCAAISISRERDLGTLEVLFYGPVDSTTYVTGKYVQQMLAFAVMLVFAVVNFYLASLVTNFGFTSDLWGMLLLSFFLASCMVSFGIFLSAVSKRMAVSVVLFLALMLFFLVFSVAHSIIVTIPGRSLTPVLVYVRVILDNMNLVVQWISPLAYFDRGSLALSMGHTGQYVISVVSSLVYSAVLLGLSIASFNRKGVKR